MQANYLSILQLLPAFLWLIIIVLIALTRKSKYSLAEQKYYMYNVYAKLFFSLAYVLFFILVYGGGDTIAYFQGTECLNNLLFENPNLYFEQLTSTPTDNSISLFFNSRTGYPPGWIYREPESFFVCKLSSIFSLITFNSFIGTTFLISYLVASASWKLFILIRRMNLVTEGYLAIGLLFMPSVNFWCTGISKDTYVYIGVLILVYHSFLLIRKESKSRIRSITILLLISLMMFHIRPVILYVTLLSLSLAYSTSIAKRLSSGGQAVVFVRVIIILGGFIGISQSLSSGSEEDFLEQNSIFQEAAITQKDFATNVTYGTSRYSIGTIEFTPIGLIRASPLAIMAGIFRPFIWESLSPSLFLNGLESSLFLYLIFYFFSNGARSRIRQIQNNELLLFAISFVLILAFVTGLTSGLFGVLVRLRAPLLPFAVILLSLKHEVQNKEPDMVELKI